MPRRSRTRTFPALLALVVALAAACGDGEADEVGDAAPASTTEPAALTTTEPAPDTTVEPASADPLPVACDLVEEAELPAALAGVTPEPEDGRAIDGLAYSQCTWESEEALMVVAVVDGTGRYEMHLEVLPGEPVDGVGDEALTAPGVSSETRGATGGRTVSALVGDRTLVVALRLDGQTAPEDVVPLAAAVAGRLG